MGRTIPSFRLVLATEKAEWTTFRNALDKSERKEFDQMWDVPKLYISACSNSVQLVPLHPIIISILFHHYKELKECISEVERIDARVNNIKKKEWSTMKKKEEKKQQEEEEVPTTTLDSYFIRKTMQISRPK